MARALASFLGQMFVLVLVAESALACSCGDRWGADWNGVMEAHSVIFAGRLVEREMPPSGWRLIDGEPAQVSRNSTDLVRYGFEVHASWRGEPRRRIALSSAYSSASCGYRFEFDQDYLVFARRDQDEVLRVSRCSPTQALALALRQRDRLGQPEHVWQALPPMPGLQALDTRLTDSDREKVQSAIDYWRDLDCGLELLYWRLEAMPIDDWNKRNLMSRIRASVHLGEPVFASGDMQLRRLLPPPDSLALPFTRGCSDSTQRWVRNRIESLLDP